MSSVDMLASTPSEDSLDYLEPLFLEHSHLDIMPATPTSHDMSNEVSGGEYPIIGLVDPLESYQAEQPHSSHEEHDWAGIFTPFINQLAPFVPHDDGDKDVGESNDVSTYCNGSSPLPVVNLQQNLCRISQGAEPSPKRRPRKQNHSCDPCRLAKRACDLPLSIEIQHDKPLRGCSTCNSRGLDCTASWLASRQSSAQHVGKRARTVSYIPVADNTASHKPQEHVLNTALIDSLTFISAPEADLARQITARDTCSQQFNLYIDIWDLPMTQCIQTCMPPCLPVGFTALTQLSNSSHFSMYFGHAQSWLKSFWQTRSTSWDPKTVAPHLFVAVGILDALFQQPGGQSSIKSTPTRDESINEGYKWVALATAAQFSISKDDLPWARGIATTTWRKARSLLFKNIAVTGSFRVALSLLLFGAILPPALETENCAEDTAYAHCEGVRRLQALCTHARSYFSMDQHSKPPPFLMGMRGARNRTNPVQTLPAQVRKMVLELIAAIEWLASILNWVRIAISHGQICASVPDLHNSNVTPGRSSPDIPQRLLVDGSSTSTQQEQKIYEMVVSQARAEEQTVTVLWRKGVEDEVVLQAVEQSVSLVVLLWKSLALLTLAVENLDYEEIQRHYSAMSTLIDAWRSSFGRFNQTTTWCLQHSGPDLRRSVLFCSNDGDLAVLQCYEIIERLEIELAQQPSTAHKESLSNTLQSMSAHRKEHRLMSALQISFLASTTQGISSPGFQGKSGLKAYVQDIAAHPHPYLIVQALSLAAKVFNDEVHTCLTQMDTKRASEMTTGLEACVQGLQVLKETLVMFPEIER